MLARFGRLLAISSTILAVAALTACGDDEGSTSSASTGTGGSGGAGGGGGSGEAGGAGGAGGGGGMGNPLEGRGGCSCRMVGANDEHGAALSLLFAACAAALRRGRRRG